MRSGMSFAAASIWMRDRLAGPHDGADAPRALYQVLDDLDRLSADRSAQKALLDPEPVSTGDEQFDALLAGWAEFKAHEFGLPVPAWTERAPVLREVWYVSPYFKARADAETPESLRRRGVRMTRVDLERRPKRCSTPN